MKCSVYVLLFLIVGLVTYGVYEYARFTHLVKIGRSLATASQAFSTDDLQTERTLLVVGDSTAVGVGTTPQLSVPARISSEFSMNVENRAVSGAKITDVIAQINTANKSSYDLVLIHAGANDVIQRTPLMGVVQSTSNLVEIARSLSPHVVFLTAGDIGEAPLWPKPLAYFISKRTQEAREIIKSQVEAEGGLYVDLYTQDFGFAHDPHTYYAPDLLHLSDKGYESWFEFIVSEIRRKWPRAYGES